jgi:hypothetical protein
MVMGMLKAGGLEVVTDGLRAADPGNPRGYFEHERVKTLDKDADTSWLESARGKAIKIISFLLTHLPDTNNYRVIFMHRDMDEVLTSQRRMLDARGEPSEPAADERIASGFSTHLSEVHDLLENRACFEVLAVNYRDVIGHPSEQAGRINQFLGGGLDPSKMVAFVDAALYRSQRRSGRG